MKLFLAEVIADMYNHTNPDLNTHAPIISQETYDVVMANADVNTDQTSFHYCYLFFCRNSMQLLIMNVILILIILVSK
jgi:hypothetical protein